MNNDHYLNSFINHELRLDRVKHSVFKVDRVAALLKLFNDPHKVLKMVHVAGSKGKGSTAIITASILARAGFRTGLYTSPHIHGVRERIRVIDFARDDCRPDDPFAGAITEAQLTTLLGRVKPHMEALRDTPQHGRLSYFEVLTALAFLHFAVEQCDIVVVETGLGGRLDATNVAPSLVAAITPISLEHTELLGDTVEKITAEKAAIIKPGTRHVVVGPQEPGALRVIEERCRECGIKVVVVGREITHDGGDITTPSQKYLGMEQAVKGKRHLENVCTAVGIIEALQQEGMVIPTDSIYKAAARTTLPCRFEKVQDSPVIILDGAHNPASVARLIEDLRAYYPRHNIRLVFGVSNDKDIFGMADVLAPHVKFVAAAAARHPRACPFTEEFLQKLFPKAPTRVCGSSEQAFQAAEQTAVINDMIVVTGSLYFTAEVRELIMKQLPVVNS